MCVCLHRTQNGWYLLSRSLEVQGRSFERPLIMNTHSSFPHHLFIMNMYTLLFHTSTVYNEYALLFHTSNVNNWYTLPFPTSSIYNEYTLPFPTSSIYNEYTLPFYTSYVYVPNAGSDGWTDRQSSDYMLLPLGSIVIIYMYLPWNSHGLNFPESMQPFLQWNQLKFW